MMKYLIFLPLLTSCFLNPYGSESESDCSFNNSCSSSQTTCQKNSSLTNPAAEGDGSGTPYKIYSASQLENISTSIATYKDSNFQLMCDIDMSSSSFTPIGSATNSYTGTFDGDGYTLSNLTMTVSGDNIGFIAHATGATVQNLTISNATFTNSYNGTPASERGNGILVGFAENSTIQNSSVSGSIDGFSYTAGLVGGTNNGGSISKSSSSVTVTCRSTSGGHGNCGGLVGALCITTGGGGSISNSYATGNVTAGTTGSATSYGGLVGSAFNGCSVSNSYATGNVTGKDRVAGLVGSLSSTASITHSFSTGSATTDGTGDTAAGVVRYASGTDPVTAGKITNINWVNNGGDHATNCWIYNSGNGDGNCTTRTQSYFYTSTNEPYATGSWDTNIWQWGGSGFPTLK